MQLQGNTVLITGGASGIGLALVEHFVKAGSEVIICGRREDKLQEAKNKWPALHTIVCDVAEAEERSALFERATREFPALNVLINNAGIQRRIQLSQGETWEQTRSEIAINLEAPIHLATLFIPHLMGQEHPALVNVTSGLSFVPMSGAPVYCATKAALRSFTLSLRFQLASTPIQVVEIIPPAVNTDLGGPGLHDFGVPLDEFAASVAQRLEHGEVEIAYGTAEQSCRAWNATFGATLERMNPG